MTRRTIAHVADAALEASIVGSFTKIGFGIRDRLKDWDNETPDLAGQTGLVTGATSGIGRATAHGLMRLGANVAITSRSLDRAEQAATALNAEGLRGKATGYQLDTGDFDSIDALVESLTKPGVPLDMLINNAGALATSYSTDDRGLELTLSSHLVGPYRLMNALRPHLADRARVLYMSSGGMYTQGLNVDQLEMTAGNYQGTIAYARAKRAQVEMVNYLGRRWAPKVIMHSMHPGWVDTPGVDAALPGFGKLMGPLLRSAEQGADTMIWLAAAAPRSKPGRFWHDRTARNTVYLPGTRTNNNERRKLIAWLDQKAEVPAHR